ncbi:MAG: 2-hydroxychromene-2-carboxylate isomerase [Pseudomonadota bacterium]
MNEEAGGGRVDFWFDFASTYSYLSIQRADAVAQAAGVALIWRPFLLGPIFAAQGWDTSPFKLYPAKGRFMFRDMARRAEALGLPFDPSGQLPVNSVHAARLALAALETEQGVAFCRRVSRALWGEGKNIASQAVLAGLAFDVGLSHDRLSARAAEPDMKPRLRAQTEEAMALGIFGAPSFTVARDGATELFWGDDQLEDALAWAETGRLAPRRTATGE